MWKTFWQLGRISLLLMVCVVGNGPTISPMRAATQPFERFWTAHPHLGLPLDSHRSIADDCEPWHCSYQDGDTLYCFLEGEQIETPGAAFVCRCEAQGTDGCTFALLMAAATGNQ